MVVAVVSGIKIHSLLEPIVDIPITRGECMYDGIIAATSHFFTSSCTLHYSQHSNSQRDDFLARYSSARTCIPYHSFTLRLHEPAEFCGCEADCACSLGVPIA